MKTDNMTLEQLTALSDDELTVKVAEALGWTDVFWGGRHSMGYHPILCENMSRERGGKWRLAIPHYSTCLNAAAEMEKALKIDPNPDKEIEWMTQRERYAMMIEFVVNSPGQFEEIAATTRQRCIAFLLTIQP